jgi:integrase/recombinase XerD
MTNNLDYWTNMLEKSESKMLPQNFKIIKMHLKKLRASKVQERTIVNHLQALMQFAIWCKVPFMQLNGEDILDYSEQLDCLNFTFKGKPKKYTDGTKFTRLIIVKAFLRSLNSEAAEIITIKQRHVRKFPEDLLKREDIEALLNSCYTARDRALIATFYESGTRKGELLGLLLKNIEFDENGVIIRFPDGKTGPRRIRVVFAASFLREWLEVHPKKNDRESPLFCSLREPFNLISETGLTYQLRKIAKRAGIEKRVNPHSFRHARATHLAEHLTEQQLKNYLGWTASSTMAANYVHLSGKDMDDAILKMNGIKIDETHTDGLKVGRCPRCKELNPEVSLYCGKCGQPLKEDSIREIDESRSVLSIDTMKMALSDPVILEQLADIIKKLNTK